MAATRDELPAQDRLVPDTVKEMETAAVTGVDLLLELEEELDEELEEELEDDDLEEDDELLEVGGAIPSG